MKKEMQDDQPVYKFKVDWNTLGEYMQSMEKRGVSCNIASYVGATTIRTNVIGEDNRDPTPAELEKMKALVKQAMEEGALGVGSSLIYPPAFFAKTNELIELCKAAAPYGGGYISHMRSEGNKLNEAVEELITIAKEAKVHGEIYHLKAAGIGNWSKMDSVIKRIEKGKKRRDRYRCKYVHLYRRRHRYDRSHASFFTGWWFWKIMETFTRSRYPC
jgi:N-acyl-D-amino-acid deacylase